jgi:uncharacterized protein
MENQRIQELDVIRGFALFGILVCNMVLFNYPIEYLGKYFSTDTSFLDKAATYIKFNIFGDKTFSIFSLLFGIGIGMQYLKSSAGFIKKHVFRMLLLFIIGVLHAFLIWYGDILSLYALLGLLALLFIRLSNKILLIIAVAAFIWPIVQTVLIRNGVFQINLAGYNKASLQELIALNTENGLSGHFTYNISQILPTIQFYLGSTLYHSFSMILLGIFVAKSGILYKLNIYLGKVKVVFFTTVLLVAIWNLYQIF